MNPVRALLYGSSLGQQAHALLDRHAFAVVDLVESQSFLSSYTRDVDLIAPPPAISAEDQRLLDGDFRSDFRLRLAASAHEIDAIIVDLVDEQLGVYLLPDGTVITRSTALIRSGGESDLPVGTRFLPFGSEQHFEYWSLAAESIGRLIASTAPGVAVVLLDVPFASTTLDGRASPEYNGLSAVDADAVFRPYVARAVASLGASRVTLARTGVFSDPYHPAGWTFFGYSGETLHALAGELSAVLERLREPQRPASALWNQPPAFHQPSLSDADVLGRTWRLSRDDGTHAVSPVRLIEDGALWGHSHPNEARWLIDDGDLVFFARDGRPSTRFSVVPTTSGEIRLEGDYLLNPKAGIRHVLETVRMDWEERERYPRLTRTHLADLSARYGWEIGDHTYGNPTVREPEMAHLSIGKFCSIDESVTIALGGHRTDTVSTYPFRTLSRYWPNGHRSPADHSTKGSVRIGNDVWIGERAVILSGVSIGDGAVIGAQSVVTTDVAPYSIVAGAPAKTIGARMDEQRVREMLAIRWWDWSDEQIDEALPAMNEDIDAFIRAARRYDPAAVDGNGAHGPYA